MAKNSIAIGFAEKFYTLWNSSYDETSEAWKFAFIKNISKDIDKVKELYPDVEVDTSLRGRTVWKKSNKIYYTYEPGIFPFGKNVGKKFSEVMVSYLSWFYENFFPQNIEQTNWWNESCGDIVNILETNGYIPREITKDYRKVYRKENYKFIGESAISKAIINDDTFQINPKTNLGENGEIRIDNVIIKFPEISKRNFQDYQYSFPVINGKAKKIKGNTIEILEYDIAEEINEPVIYKEDNNKYVEYSSIKKIIVRLWNII